MAEALIKPTQCCKSANPAIAVIARSISEEMRRGDTRLPPSGMVGGLGVGRQFLMNPGMTKEKDCRSRADRAARFSRTLTSARPRDDDYWL